MRIVPISLPTPFPVGPVNVYLVKDDPVTLIDTGPKTRGARDALWEGLRAAGVRPFDIKRIVLTHTHEDHFGLARTLLNETKGAAQIYVHAWETGHLAARLQYEDYRVLLTRAGVDEKEIEEMRVVYEAARGFADELHDAEYKPLADDAEIEFASGSLRVVHTPGHTPGSISLVREADRTVVAGDCVLKRITPNPILSPDPVNPEKRFPSLAEYLVSLARIRSFAPTLVYGGHGEAIDDYEEVFARYLRNIRERQAHILGSLPKAGASASEVARTMFPNAGDVHRFLAISEAVAHLDYAHREGKVMLETDIEGREIFLKQ